MSRGAWVLALLPRAALTAAPCPRILQDMELAHRELLLRSLGDESSGGTTPVGSAHTEAATARWTDSSLSPATKDLLASDCRDSHDLEPRPEPGE